MPKRKLTDKQEREVALNFLCHVSPEYIQERWGVCNETVRQNILRGRAPYWNDPLVNFYSKVWKSGNFWGNAAHIYLFFRDQAEGLPKLKLIDKAREQTVYDSVDSEIFAKRNHRLLYEDTKLVQVFSAPVMKTGEEKILEAVFGKFPEENAKRIALPMLYRRLRKAYAAGIVDLSRVYSSTANDIFNYLRECVQIGENKEARAVWEDKRKQLQEKIREVLETLTSREKEILKLRYGLSDGKIYTGEEVGRQFKVTRTRVQQIESKAIRKLQHPSRVKMIISFMRDGEEEFDYPVHRLKGKESYTPEEREKILKSPVTDFELSGRSCRVLDIAGVKTIEDLCNLTESELLCYKNCGDTTIWELRREILTPYQLDFEEEKK